MKFAKVDTQSTIAPLTVTSGASYCEIDSNGCVTNDDADSGVQACTIQVNSAGTLTAIRFEDVQFDYFTIGGTRYNGAVNGAGPVNVDVAAGSTFSWTAVSYTSPSSSSHFRVCHQSPGADFAHPIIAAVIQQLDADSDVVSMRSFGYQQLEGTSWSDVCDWISPISLPTDAGSMGTDAVTFWGEFEQIVDLQAIRKNSGNTSMARDYLETLPAMFANHTVSAAAAAVEKDFPTDFPTTLAKKFLREKVVFDKTVVPHTGNDFVNKVVMLADVIGWAVSIVSPTAFATKWQNGRARPEEVAWAVHSEDAHVASASATVVNKIKEGLGLIDAYNFTAYKNGSPKHPSWPAMHSAASSASLHLAVLLNLNPAQLAEARSLDCAVASFRTLAGVHYESDNMTGLAIGQEVIRRELPVYLAERYGSDLAAVELKINSVIEAHDWRNASSCFKPQASWPTLSPQ